MSSCNNKVETVNISNIAIDTLASLPDYILGERDITDDATGVIKRTPVRIASAKLFPNVNNDNVIGLAVNNTAITVPEKQVRAGYISNEPGALVMKYADASNHADFLMLGLHTDNIMRVQNTGFVNIPEGHGYIPNAQYYLGENGEPVTDPTVTGQKLFKPMSSTVLAINMDN